VRENVKDKEEATMKVSDLSIDEFKELIGKVIEEKIRELVDSDYGLELREDFVHALENSIASKERISFEEVKKKIWIKLIECLIWFLPLKLKRI
jgi:signal recognition particle GTPase